MMRLSSRPCSQTVLTFLMLLQLAFKISLQEEITLKGRDLGTELALSELEQLELQIQELKIPLSRLKEILLKIGKVFPGFIGKIVGGKILKRRDAMSTFQGGKNSCDDDMNGKLVLPRNAEENEALKQIIERRNERAFLGIIYNASEDKFEDLNGQPIQFSKWASEQPKIQKDQKCVIMKSNGEWSIHYCEERSAVICEFSI